MLPRRGVIGHRAKIVDSKCGCDTLNGCVFVFGAEVRRLDDEHVRLGLGFASPSEQERDGGQGEQPDEKASG